MRERGGVRGSTATAVRVRCRVLRCKGMRRVGRELCDRCWTRVPADLRRRIHRLNDNDDTHGSRAYGEAILEAIRIAGEGIRA